MGVVSVASNLFPSEVCALVRAAESGDLKLAEKSHRKLLPLFKDLFIEPNPVPVKTALGWRGAMSSEVRLPLCEMSASEPGPPAQDAGRLRMPSNSALLATMKNFHVHVLLIGAAGRMGKSVLDLAQSDPEIEIAAQCDLGDSIEPAMANCDVAIDFSQADSIDEICRAALKRGKPLVVGTTGHSQRQRKTIEEIAHCGTDRVGIEFQRRSQRTLLADAKGCGIARRGFQSGDCRKASQNEKRCAEWDSQNTG